MLSEKLLTLRKKAGFSQQELADKLNVTRQTISNWECGQGAPALDKAAELAAIYHITLDDLTDNQVSISVKAAPCRDDHILQSLVGKQLFLSCTDMEHWLGTALDCGTSPVTLLEVQPDWLRISYTRTKDGTLFQKETVTRLLDRSAVLGMQIMEVEK